MRRLLTLVIVVAFLYPLAANSTTNYKTTNYANDGVSLSMDEPIGSVYKDGEEVGFSIRTDTDAYVVVFNIDTEGFVHLLYPRDGKNLRKFSSGRVYYLPEDRDEALVVGGTTGIEFVFAVAVEDYEYFNEEEIRFLADNAKLPDNRKFKIEGDPFLAANRVASQLVRGISNRRGVTLSFSYFYINEAVDFPRYLCDDCYKTGNDPYAPGMPAYVAYADFDKTDRLTYPLEQGFVREYANEYQPRFEGNNPDVTKVYVSYYPKWDHGYYDTSWWYSDPWYGWPYYSSYGSGFYWSVGWNWGWGSGWGWGACRNYYFPYYYSCGPSYYWPCATPYNYYPSYTYPRRSFRPTPKSYRNDLHTASNYKATRDVRSGYKNGYKSLEKRVSSDGMRVARTSKQSSDLRTSYKSLRGGGSGTGNDARVIRSKPLRGYKNDRSRDVRSKTVSSRERRVITRTKSPTTTSYGKRSSGASSIRRTSRDLGRSLGDSRSGRTNVKSRGTKPDSKSNRTYKPNTRRGSSGKSSGSSYKKPATRSTPKARSSGRKSSGSSRSRSGGKGKR